MCGPSSADRKRNILAATDECMLHISHLFFLLFKESGYSAFIFFYFIFSNLFVNFLFLIYGAVMICIQRRSASKRSAVVEVTMKIQRRVGIEIKKITKCAEQI